MINVVKATIQRTALTIIARRNIVRPVSKVLPKVSQDAPILLFGRNQTEAAEYVEGSSMESCFRAHLIEYETFDKEKQKIKEQLEKDLDEPPP